MQFGYQFFLAYFTSQGLNTSELRSPYSPNISSFKVDPSYFPPFMLLLCYQPLSRFGTGFVLSGPLETMQRGVEYVLFM